MAAVDSASAGPEPTGTLVIVNAGPDVRLTIDGAAASGNRHELAAGVYELRLLRSGYREVVEERNVLSGKVDTLRVQWQQRPAVTVSEGRDGPDFVAAGPAQCLDPDPRTYNRDGACFDQAPGQIDPTFVPHRIVRRWPIAVVAVVWVRVETNGRSSAATIARSSGDSAYDSFAVQTARRLRYEPARRDGQPVQAWAQFRFQPDPSRP